MVLSEHKSKTAENKRRLPKRFGWFLEKNDVGRRWARSEPVRIFEELDHLRAHKGRSYSPELDRVGCACAADCYASPVTAKQRPVVFRPGLGAFRSDAGQTSYARVR